MRVYLDDDLDSNALIGLLRLAGHGVVSPRFVETRGIADRDHLLYAASNELVLLTANPRDFITLHNQWQSQQQVHSGILIVYRENDPGRSLNFRQIVEAVTNLEQSGLTIPNQVYNLNFWRVRPGP